MNSVEQGYKRVPQETPVGSLEDERLDICSNWVYISLKISLALNVVMLVLLIATLIIVAVTPSQMDSELKDEVLSLKQTMWCTLNNFCDGTGFGAACELRKSIHQCGLGVSHGATSGVTEYLSQFSPGSSHHSPPSPSTSAGTSLL